LRADNESRALGYTTLTAAGRGAIGVIAVWGHGALTAVDAAFRPTRGRSLAETPPGRPRLGRIGRGLGDEVVAVVLEESPPAVEIQCHGGPAALALVVEALRDAGLQPAELAAWAEQQSGSPIRAAALVDLGSAPTVRAASILLDQATGSLERELDQLIAEISPESTTQALERIDRLIAQGSIGVKLTTGWRVVIRGRPNVGKSRLLNALAGYQRAVVASTPGTTRDVITIPAAFDGWPVQLIDTAGVRETEDELESVGIKRAAAQARSADLVLQVLDRSEPLTTEDRVLLEHSTAERMILVASKADLPPKWGPEDPALNGSAILVVSAECGEGLESLMTAVSEAIVPEPPRPKSGVPFRQNQLDCLRAAASALGRNQTEKALAALSILHRGGRH
jgi:tRNA modification GTPase